MAGWQSRYNIHTVTANEAAAAAATLESFVEESVEIGKILQKLLKILLIIRASASTIALMMT